MDLYFVYVVLTILCSLQVDPQKMFSAHLEP